MSHLFPGPGTVLVTHKSCLDGTGSALMFLWAGGRRSNVLFRTPSRLILSPDELPDGTTEVWYADCCPPSLQDPAAGLPFRVFDHHVSNQRLFGDDPRCVFDMSKSGTSLMASVLGCMDGSGAWEQHRLDLIEALESYDLGRFDSAVGMRLADLASSYTQDEMLDMMAQHSAHHVLYHAELTSRAEAMACIRGLYAGAAFRAAAFPSMDLGIGLMRVGVACSPVYWKNEVAERILDSGRAELAVVIDLVGGMCSLRSRPGGPDCSVIATKHGGGGHATAAGFKLSNSQSLIEALGNGVFQ